VAAAMPAPACVCGQSSGKVVERCALACSAVCAGFAHESLNLRWFLGEHTTIRLSVRTAFELVAARALERARQARGTPRDPYLGDACQESCRTPEAVNFRFARGGHNM